MFGNNYLLQLAERERERERAKGRERKWRDVWHRSCKGGEKHKEGNDKGRDATLLHLLKLTGTVINIQYLRLRTTFTHFFVSSTQESTHTHTVPVPELKSFDGSRAWLNSAACEHKKMG